MNWVARVLAPATKALALGSLVLAIGCVSWLARPVWHLLPHAAAVAAVTALVAGRLAPALTSVVILSLTYVAPVLVLATKGRFSVEFLLVWSAALTGLMLADRGRWTWSYPRRWQFPLVLWALTVAVAWPITALRELDFESLALLERYRVANTGIGGGPRLVILWGIDTAIVHLLGLLWFDWLLRTSQRPGASAIERRVVWPLAASAVAGALLALYQGIFDLTFLSVGAWGVMQRAAGPLLDANASGMVFALWTAGLLALTLGEPRGRAVALLALPACWGGLWMSGSRTALATAVVALVSAGVVAVLRVWDGSRRRAWLTTAAGAGVVAAIVTLLLVLPVGAESPVQRIRRTLPAELSRDAFGQFVGEMWNRHGYGAAATALIAERPLTGVGIGLFNLSGAAYGPLKQRGIPPDNAQNWWRHHVAELGMVGAAGLLLWTAVFLWFLGRTSGAGDRRVPAAAVKGALVGFGLISLFGMPAQSLAVAMTFWALAAWYVDFAGPGPSANASRSGDLRPWAWIVVLAVVAAYLTLLVAFARGRDRPVVRAAEGGWRYAYGIYDAAIAAPDGELWRQAERHGVAAIANEGPWMVLTVRAEHPDLQTRPVRAAVKVNGRTIVDTALHTDAPLTRAVHTGAHARAVIETTVDRTWRPRDAEPDHPEVGLTLSWRFSDRQPPGLAAITAPFDR